VCDPCDHHLPLDHHLVASTLPHPPKKFYIQRAMSAETEDVKPKLNLNISYDGNQITVKVNPPT
jgi:hypothetical protein